MHDDLQRLGHAVRLGQDPRNRVLELLEVLGPHRDTDIVRDAAVAAEPEPIVEDGLASEAHEAGCTVTIGQRQDQIAKRLALGEQLALCAPIVGPDGRSAHLSHGLASELLEATRNVRRLT